MKIHFTIINGTEYVWEPNVIPTSPKKLFEKSLSEDQFTGGVQVGLDRYEKVRVNHITSYFTVEEEIHDTI